MIPKCIQISELKKQINSLIKEDYFNYNNLEYGQHIKMKICGKVANLRYWNWGSTGQLKDNEKYSIQLPVSSYNYINSKFISISGNTLEIKKQSKDTWNDETITFLIN